MSQDLINMLHKGAKGYGHTLSLLSIAANELTRLRAENASKDALLERARELAVAELSPYKSHALRIIFVSPIAERLLAAIDAAKGEGK